MSRRIAMGSLGVALLLAPHAAGSVRTEGVRLHGYLVGNPAYATAKARAAASVRTSGRAGAAAGRLPVPAHAWDGVYDPNAAPGGAGGAIGTTRYVELTNQQYGVYSRTGNPVDLGGLWNLAAKPKSIPFEPQVIWDPDGDRFYYAMLDLKTNGLYVGFSKTAAPAGPLDWCKYAINAGYRKTIPDFLRLGDTRDFLLVGLNVFSQTGLFLRSDVVWLSKPVAVGAKCPRLKHGVVAGLKGPDGSPAESIVPANQIDGSGTGWIVAARDVVNQPASSLSLFPVTRDPKKGKAVIGAAQSVPVAAYALPPNAPQEGTSNVLDTLDGRLTTAVAAIDPAHGDVALWTQHTVAGGAGTEVRWYELDTAGHSVLQAGEAADGTLWTFNGAISPDRVVHGATTAYGSDMALGFDTSSPSDLPAVQAVSKSGASPQTAFVLAKQSLSALDDLTCAAPYGPPCFWGASASASPDPAPDCGPNQVWLTNEWAEHGPIVDWRTWNWSMPLTYQLTDFTPEGGPAGASVTVHGHVLAAVDQVSFAGQAAASFAVDPSGDSITAAVPDSASSGPISVATTNGCAARTRAAFKVVAITGFEPQQGTTGIPLTIHGRNFQFATGVKVGGAEVDSFDVSGDGTQITTTVPLRARNGRILVETAAGPATSPGDDFSGTFHVVPTISDFSPDRGPPGTVVTLHGTGFLAVGAAVFGLVLADPATIHTNDDGTELTVEVPDAASGFSAKINLATGVTNATTPGFFTLFGIRSLNENVGGPGDSFLVNGWNIGNATSVKFNGVPASFAPLPGETDRLSVTVPDGVSTGPVTVTTPLGTATSPAPFYHVAITGFDPTDGGVGTEVTVTGVGFTELPITLVALGGFIMPGLAVDDDSHLRFTVSDLAVTGKIMIRMAAGDVFSADNFVVPMTITDFTPTSGPVGTAVVVTGTGWVFPDGVQFNGIPAPFFYDPITRELHTGVPDGATTGPITVSVGAQSATSAENFTVTP